MLALISTINFFALIFDWSFLVLLIPEFWVFSAEFFTSWTCISWIIFSLQQINFEIYRFCARTQKKLALKEVCVGFFFPYSKILKESSRRVLDKQNKSTEKWPFSGQFHIKFTRSVHFLPTFAYIYNTAYNSWRLLIVMIFDFTIIIEWVIFSTLLIAKNTDLITQTHCLCKKLYKNQYFYYGSLEDCRQCPIFCFVLFDLGNAHTCTAFFLSLSSIFDWLELYTPANLYYETDGIPLVFNTKRNTCSFLNLFSLEPRPFLWCALRNDGKLSKTLNVVLI